MRAFFAREINQMILPLPQREKVERELRDQVLERGEQEQIARCIQIKPSRISRQLDPENDSCPSPIWGMLQWLWGLDFGGRRRGDALLRYLIREREKWLVNLPNPERDAGELTSHIFKSAADFLETEAGDSDIDTQLNKLDFVRLAVDAKANQLKAVRAQQKGLIG